MKLNLLSVFVLLISSAGFSAQFSDLAGVYEIQSCQAVHNSHPQVIDYCQYQTFQLSSADEPATMGLRFTAVSQQPLAFNINLESLTKSSALLESEDIGSAQLSHATADEFSSLAIALVQGSLYEMRLATFKSGGISYDFKLILKKMK